MPIDLKNQVISGTEILTQIFIISQKKNIGEPKKPQQFSFIFIFFGQTLFRHPEQCEFWRNENRAEKCNYCANKNNYCANKCNYCKKKEIIVQKICNYCANKTIFIAQKIQLMWVKKKHLLCKKMHLLREKNNCCAKKKTIIVEKIRFRRDNTHVQAAF